MFAPMIVSPLRRRNRSVVAPAPRLGNPIRFSSARSAVKRRMIGRGFDF
jgi:hypothetical protein